MKAENRAKLKEREPKIGDFRLNVAEMVGFEPTCRLITDKTISSQVSKNELDGI